ncbi:MAG: 50S ribosomal protein L10, partial [candidate division WOR-3 bacterium]|nr:50S ribosomal protein L10 [candidate division WOR-3 bacterium]
MKKEGKQKLIETLKKELESATGIYFLDFTGLSAQEMSKLRTAMRNEHVKIKVVKNIVARFILENLKLNNLLCFLDGP